MSPVDYKSGAAPTDYACSECKATGVRLWRPYNQCAPDLLCYDCALADQGKAEGEGRAADGYQIGWLVPAVPTESGLAYWGYGAIPQPGVVWWQGLPERVST